MWLVLCETHDASATWAFSALRARGLAPLEILGAQELALSDFQEHRLEGLRTTLRFRTEAGLQVDGQRLSGVINRLYTVPTGHWRQASEADRSYVQQEMFAFFLSWLHALPCPVLNRPTPQGLCGQWRQESEWAWLARQAGLPVAVYRQTSRDTIDEALGQRRLVPAGALVSTVIVVGGCVVGTPIPPDLRDGCLRLANLARTSLLGIDLVESPTRGWQFAGASPTPDLRLGGDALVDALMQELGHRERAAA
jgi:hypothetical protein